MTTSSLSTAPRAAAAGTRNRVLWGAQIVLALFFLVAAAGPKLAGEQTAVDIFAAIGIGMWFMHLVGTLELLGAVGLVVPRLAGWAALGLAGVMVGATLTQLFVLESPALALTPAVLGLLLGTIAWARLR